jgi:DNA-binding response OmpR family regulator
MTREKGKLIIVLDTDIQRGREIIKLLNKHGFITLYSRNIATAEEYCSEYSPDLLFIISSFDINSVLQFSKRFKAFKPSCKILLSSVADISNILSECFKNGIDDYISNPLNQYELTARIKKNLSLIGCNSFIEYHGIRLCTVEKYVIINSVCIYLSKKETIIMEYIINNRGAATIESLCLLLSIMEQLQECVYRD